MKPLLPNGRTCVRLIAISLVSVLLAVVFQLSRAQAAATFTVNSLADTSDAAPGNGACADAGGQCTLRAAIEEANALSGDDTINFSVTGTINLTSALPSLTNMTINGPGSGLLTVRRDTGGNYRIFLINGFIVRISGLTVTNGRTPDGTSGSVFGNPGGDGAGISATGTVTLTDVVVTGNRTGNGGPGGSSTGGWGGSGAGIAAAGTLTLTNVTVSNNTTGNGETGNFGGTGGRGGGIFFNSGTLTITNSTISGNTTGNGASGTAGGASGGGGGDGGGILMNGGTLTMTNVVVTGNNTGDANFGGTGGQGGGLMTMPGINSTILNVTFSNNTTGDGGGGVTGQGGRGGAVVNFGIMVLKNSTLSGNSTGTAGASGGDSGGTGGGLFNVSEAKVINTTISGNSTNGFNAPGGGIYQIGSALTVINSTITGNASVSHIGNGIYQSTNVNGVCFIQNSIVAQNIGGPDTWGTFSSFGPNLIGNADDSTGFNPSDLKGTTAAPLNAMLGPLANNGGPTQTHALLAGSPALDAGDSVRAIDADNNALTTDQRGTGRIADSEDAGTTATVDIGAYEFHQTLDEISDKTINEDTTLSFVFAVGDGGPAVTSVTATSTNTTLLPNANLSVTGSGAVRTLQATPVANSSGATTITVTANLSGGGAVQDTFQLTVLSVNDAPSFTKGADQTINEDAGAQTVNNWATAISAGPNEAGQTLTFNIVNDNPGLFSAAPAISASGTLTYTPAANAVGAANLTVTLSDNGGTANGGQDTSAPQTLKITVVTVNDPPSFTKGADQTVAEDPGFVSVPNWATNISAGPPNEFPFVEFIVTNNTNPSLFSSGPAISNSGTLTYMPALNANGSADITIVARDFDGVLNGGVNTSASQTFKITVTAVNDAPVNNGPSAFLTNQNTPVIFSAANGSLISVSDVDAGNDPISVTLTATEGTLTLASTAGLTLSTGDGTDDATIAFSGTLTAINAALNGMTFKPTTGFSGTATLQIVSNDNGHNGAGGPQSSSRSFSILVRSGGRFSFNTATYGVNENAGTATITVLRTGGIAGTASVSYATSNGSATSGSSCSTGVDYLPTSGTFTWTHGDTSVRQFTVTICNDASMEGDETINLTLSNPTGTGSLGTQPTAVLTIGTDDGPVLLMDDTNQEAIALDLVNLTRDPFSLSNPFNMSTDQRRRISLFVWQVEPLTSNDVALVTASARDTEFRTYLLQVEALAPVANVPGVTQVVVRLPDSIIGAPRELLVKLTVNGMTTNEAFIFVSGP